MKTLTYTFLDRSRTLIAFLWSGLIVTVQDLLLSVDPCPFNQGISLGSCFLKTGVFLFQASQTSFVNVFDR